MIKLIIACCELIIGSMGNNSYSYEARYTDDSKYSITLYTTQKYNIGDTINILVPYTKIDWSDTMEMHSLQAN
jgi:hypothetical protein